MLDIDPLLMLLVFVVFIVSVYLLNEWLYKPLLSFMDERDRAIKESLESVRGNEAKILTKKAEAEDILSEARREAATIREEAYESAKKDADVRIEAKRSELDRQKSDYLLSLNEEGKVLHGALLSQMSLFKEALKIKLKQL